MIPPFILMIPLYRRGGKLPRQQAPIFPQYLCNLHKFYAAVSAGSRRRNSSNIPIPSSGKAAIQPNMPE